MNDDKQDTSNTTGDGLKPADVGGWDEMIETMHDYLATVREHAEKKKERAAEQLEEREATIDELEKAHRKRRNYGTRTGIILKGEEIERDE